MYDDEWSDDGPASNQGVSFDRIEKALDKLDDDADSTFWDSPAVGDVLAGVLTATERGTTREGDDYPILVLETPTDGTVRVRASRTQLRSKLREKQPVVGDTIALRFEGTKKSAKNRDFYAYSVVVVKEGASQ